jgi:hypothetical protein
MTMYANHIKKKRLSDFEVGMTFLYVNELVRHDTIHDLLPVFPVIADE